MINKDYELLLNENYLDELYEYILTDYIKLFSEIVKENINVEILNEDNVEDVFRYFLWKVFKYSKTFNEKLLRLRRLFLDIGWDNSQEKNILVEMEELYYDIKEKSKVIKELNISDYLKELTRNNEYEFAIELVQNLYYYPKIIDILEKKKISYKKYGSFSNISDTLKVNCSEYRSILLNINGYYSYDITLQEELSNLLEYTEVFEDE